MKKLIAYFDYIPDIFLLIVAFFLPTFPAVSQVAILLFLIFWITKGQYKYLYKIKEHVFALGSIAVFALYFLSGLYSDNLTFWGSNLEAKLPLLILPILLLSRENYDQKVVNSTLWAFGLGCLSLIIYLHYEHISDPEFTFSRTMAIKTIANSIYFAMYLSFVLLIGFVLNFKKIIQFNFKSFLLLAGLCWFHYAIYALASRMAILGTIGVELMAVFVWKIILDRKIIQAGVMMFLIILVNFFSLNFAQKATKKRIKKLRKQGDVRELIWKGSWMQIAKSPIIGYGAGDTQDMLIEAYKTLDYNHGVKKKQNCHNQYLQILMTAGIIGLLVFLAWLLLSFRSAWLAQNYLFCIFVAIFALNILTESMLERQQGTYFVAFFGSLLLWKNEERTRKNQS